MPKNNTHKSRKKDSLQKIITNHPKDYEEKVRLLNEYARECFYNQKLLKGFDATREARSLSEKLHFEGGKIMYYLTLSAYYGNRSTDMETYYQMKAKWLAKSRNDESSNYYTELNGPKLDFNNDYEAQLKEYIKLLNHFEALDDKEIQAAILNQIAFFYYDLGQNEEGIKTADRIINYIPN